MWECAGWLSSVSSLFPKAWHIQMGITSNTSSYFGRSEETLWGSVCSAQIKCRHHAWDDNRLGPPMWIGRAMLALVCTTRNGGERYETALEHMQPRSWIIRMLSIFFRSSWLSAVAEWIMAYGKMRPSRGVDCVRTGSVCR